MVERMSNVLNFVQAGGIVMIPLLLMSIASIAIIIERWMVFRRAVYSPRRTSAIPPGSELSSERVAAVAVSSHAQAQHSIRIES